MQSCCETHGQPCVRKAVAPGLIGQLQVAFSPVGKHSTQGTR